MSAGKAGREADGETAGRDVLDRGDRGGLCHDVAQAWNEHRRAELDALGMLGDLGHARPHVLPEGRRVGEPDALIAERFGQPRVLDGLRSRGQQTREPQGHGVPPLCGSSEIDIAPPHRPTTG